MKDKFPILAIENNCLVNVNGDITYPLELTLPKIYGLSDDEIVEIGGIWKRIFKSLPEGYILHKQDIFSEQKFTTKREEKDSLLALSSKLLYNNRLYLEQRTFLYVSMSRKIDKNSSQSNLITVLKNEIFTAKEIKDFFDTISFIKELFSSSQLIKVKDLSKEDLVGTSDKFGILEQYTNLDFSKFPSVCDYSYDSKENLLKIGNKFVGIYGITNTQQLPFEVTNDTRIAEYSTENTDVYASFMHPITTGLHIEHITNQYFFVDNQKKLKKQIETQAKHQMSLGILSKENAQNSKANDEFLNEIDELEEKIISTAVNVVFWGENFNQFSNLKTKVRTSFSNMNNTIPKEISVNIFQFFWAGIAGNAASYPHEEKILLPESSTTCFISNEAHFKPSAFEQTDMTLPVILSDRSFGIPVAVDMMNRSKVNNFNKFVLGGSGGGKSFFTNHATRQYFDNGGHVMIIDIGASYFDLSQLIKEQTKGKHGLFYEYSEESPLSINPFQSESLNLSLEKKSFLTALMFTLWKRPDESITQAESTHVDTSINLYEAYAIENNIQMSFFSYYEFLRDEFVKYIESHRIEAVNFDYNNFVQVLRPFYKGGSYDYLFNPKEDTNLFQNRFVVFELDNIKDHPILYRVITLIIIDLFIEKMKKLPKSVTKALLIEEAWKILSSSHTSDFVKELYKTARKFSGEIWTITQDILDLLSNTASAAITKNSDYRIFLDVRKEKFNPSVFKKSLGLSDKEFNLLMSLNLNNKRKYKEVLICKSGKVNEAHVYAVEVNKVEYAAYTSDAPEVEKKKQFALQTKNHTQKILEYSKTLK